MSMFYHLDERGLPHRKNTNARFWVRHRGSWVKLTLKPKGYAVAKEGGPTDEGCSYSATTWEFDGETVFRSYASWGRDCDGRHEDGGEDACPLGMLKARDQFQHYEVAENVGIFCPIWASVDSWQRDHTAESAGY